MLPVVCTCVYLARTPPRPCEVCRLPLRGLRSKLQRDLRTVSAVGERSQKRSRRRPSNVVAGRRRRHYRPHLEAEMQLLVRRGRAAHCTLWLLALAEYRMQSSIADCLEVVHLRAIASSISTSSIIINTIISTATMTLLG